MSFRSRRLPLRRIFLALFTLFFALILSEPLIRLADPPGLQYYRRSKMVHAYHDDYTISLRPSSSEYLHHPSGLWSGQFSVNSLGMHDLEEPQPGRPKMICLGDSLSMGHGVGDGLNFCHLLKSKLPSVQVLNASVDGFGTYAYAVRTEEILTQLDSVKTILLFPTPTDWWIPQRFRDRGILPDDEKDQLRLEDSSYNFVFRLQFQLTEWFYTLQAMKLMQEQLILRFSILRNSISAFVDDLFQQSASSSMLQSTDYLKRTFLLQRSVDVCATTSKTRATADAICPEPVPSTIQCTDKPAYAASMPAFSQANLDRLIAATRRGGVRLIVVLLPMQDEEIRCASAGKHHPNEEYAVQARQFFKSRNIDVVDLLPNTRSMCSLTEADGRYEYRHTISDYYLREDGHLTVLGNQWAADTIADELQKRNLITEVR